MKQRAELIINNVPEYAKKHQMWLVTLDPYNKDQAWFYGAWDTDEEISNVVNELGRDDVLIVHNKGGIELEIVDKKELVKAFENDCAGECAICSHVYGFDDCGMVKDFPTIKAIPLDKVKQAREEIENLRLHKAEFITNDSKVCIDSKVVLEILDRLIESEE